MEVKLAKVGFIMLGVKSVPAALPFYRDVLGLAVKWAMEDLVFLDAGGVTLVLRPAPGGTPDAGQTEIVFEVEDIDAAHASLAARGVEFRLAPRVVTPGKFAADFRDPDGHVFSIFGPRASA
jgi:catechol 2,3-dioxygenase-like lactoylglutathione lyase family enzyme